MPLLSITYFPTCAVSSELTVLTSLFGMVRGVIPVTIITIFITSYKYYAKFHESTERAMMLLQ